MSTSKELFECVSKGELDQFKNLLRQQPKLGSVRNDQGISLVMWAKYHRREDFVQALRETKPELNAFELAALGEGDEVASAIGQDPELVNEKSADGFTLLHLAAFFDHPALVRLLLEHQSEPNAVADNPSRVSPLHSAVASGNAESVALLLAHGAEADARQTGGWTALHSAAKQGSMPMCQALLAAGADPHAPSDDGKSAIDLAQEAGQSECVELLSR